MKYKKINLIIFKTVHNTLLADFIDHFVHRVVARVEKNVCQEKFASRSLQKFIESNISNKYSLTKIDTEHALRFCFTLFDDRNKGKKQTYRARIGNERKAKKVITVIISSAIFAKTTQAKFIRN